jgi:fatty-acyl-CoA synthase
MEGLMMDWPLTLHHFLDRAARLFPRKEIATRTAAGMHRYTYADFHRRVHRLAHALTRLGIGRGDRVATFAWNTYRHLEIYFAAPCMGAVLHTLNIRLAPDQLIYIINHAEDRVIFVDASLVPLLERIRDQIPTVKAFVIMSEAGPVQTSLSPALDYEALLAESPEAPYPWPRLDENAAAGMCYTSGTTGNPKGMFYSHRAIFLHSMALCLADTFGICERDVLMPVVPMFHANAWGMPFAGVMVGAKLVFPGPHLQPRDIAELIQNERVTVTAGVPTIWIGLYALLERERYDLSSLRVMPVGGSAMPRALIEAFEKRFGIRIAHAWGMTEMTPLGTVANLKSYMESWPDEERFAVRAKQGMPVVGVEIRAVDEQGREVPWDGKTMGELQVRGPWGDPRLLQRPPHRRGLPGRVVPHRGRGDHRPGGLHPDRGPDQGPDQERRGVDLLGGPGERPDGPPQGPGGGGHRRAAPQVAGAPAGRGGPSPRVQGGPHQGRAAGVPAAALRQVVAPR